MKAIQSLQIRHTPPYRRFQHCLKPFDETSRQQRSHTLAHQDTRQQLNKRLIE
jgi:hypothetical protein